MARERGTVKWFDEVKRYGFIALDSGADIFVHASQVETLDRALEKGSRVEFDVGTGKKGAEAHKVVILDLPEA